MSVTKFDGTKIVLDRRMPLADAVREFAGDDPDRLRMIAAAQLHQAGWPFSLLGRLFGKNRGNVNRWVLQLEEELHQHCGEPDL